MKPIKDTLIFDLHCDTLTYCHKHGLDLVNAQSQLSLDRLPKGYRLCQCMAVFMPDEYRGAQAERFFDQLQAFYLEQTARCRDRVCAVRDTAAIGEALAEKPFALLLTVEGGSALAGKLENVQRLHNLGVKMMTLTWNGENEIAGGAATGLGFKPFGRRVVAEMERLGMVVDVSHLSDKSFWELASFASRPFVASHSNARELCGHRRALTKEMFLEIRDRGGLVGLNYYVGFITKSGESDKMEDLLAHLHYFLELDGEDTVALGSDFDGADMPPYLSGIERVAELRQAVEDAVGAKLADKLFFENARRFFAGNAALEE